MHTIQGFLHKIHFDKTTYVLQFTMHAESKREIRLKKKSIVSGTVV